MRTNEVDLNAASNKLDVPAEILCRMAEAGELKSRCADGTVYFLVEQIEVLARRQSDEARAMEAS